MPYDMDLLVMKFKKRFIELLYVSPSGSYMRVLETIKGIDDAIADCFHVPDYKWVFNFHKKNIKNRFGSADGGELKKISKNTMMNVEKK